MIKYPKKNGQKEKDHSESITPQELFEVRSRSLRTKLIVAIGGIILILFISFFELFILTPGLPPVGEITHYALRTPYDFVDVTQPIGSEWLRLEKSAITVIVDEPKRQAIYQEYEAILNDIEAIRLKKNDDLTADLKEIQVKLGAPITLESVKKIATNPNLKNLKAEILDIIEPFLKRGILADELLDSGQGLIIVNPSDQTFTVVSDSDASNFTAQSVRRSVVTTIQERFTLDKNAKALLETVATVYLKPTLTISKDYELRLHVNAEEPQILGEFFRRGQVYVPLGKSVEPSDIHRQKASLRSGNYPMWLIALVTFVIFSMVIVFYILYCEHFFGLIFLEAKHYLLLMLSLIIMLMLVKPILLFTNLSPFCIPIGLIPLLTVTLIDKRAALITLIAASFVTALVTEFSLYLFLYLFLSGCAALFLAIKYKNIRELILSSFMLGFLNVLIVSCFYIFSNQSFSMKNYLTIVLEAFLGGITWLIGLILIPFFERIFDISTDFRLLEFSDYNHPLLKQLLESAPGSYHHSIMTGNLAGIAADALGVNTLLARVGGYYHDIGKLSKPDFFMENIVNDNNLHSNLSPIRSIGIIKEHVTKGVELGLKYKLPKALIDIIEEHHGTTMMESFYYKTMKDDLNKDIPQEFFRYSGNRPKTVESALVMIADSVEAISRVVSDLTEEKAESIIREVIKNKFQDGQFEEAALSTKQLSSIAVIMARALMGKGHRRKRYPESPNSR